MATTLKNDNGDNGTGGNQGTSSSKKFFSYGFDIRCVRRFLRINKVLFPRVLSKTVGWLMSLVVFRYLLYSLLQTDVVNNCSRYYFYVFFNIFYVFSAVEEFLGYRVGLISGQFYNVLGSKDRPGFVEVSWQSLILISGITLAKSARVFTSKMLAIAWRLNITRSLHQTYFSDRTYYSLNTLGKR